jgi:single stranded DNA-binding protein
MSNVNSGSMVGNIVSDIIVKAINNDLSVVQFRVAPSNNRETDSPIPVVAYNGVGERVSQQFNKGDLVALEYRLRYTTWQDQEGNPRGRHEVVATSIDMLRLGKISTAQRAEQAAGVAKSDDKAAAKQPQLAFAGEPTAEEVIF